jgi:hypothetical protein
MGGRMRLLSVFFTAAVVTLVAALGATAAAAQSTGQTLETREMKRSESTTRAPDPEQGAREGQADAACPGAVPVGSVGPTNEDLLIGPFTVTGDSFRMTYKTTNADESGLPFFDVTVLDQAGKEIGGRVIFEEGVQQEIVRASPGRFKIEAIADDLEYTLTVEDCTGKGNPSGGSRGGGGPASDNQYGNDGGPPDEDVIDDTISDEPLPNTGGVPLLGIAAFGLIFTLAAFALLRPVIRRDS